jgi:hypothetical protein
MRLRPAGRDTQRVKTGVAAHSYDIEPAAFGCYAELTDEQGTQAGGEETGRGDAAQVAYGSKIGPGVFQALADRARGHVHRHGLVLGEQISLRLSDRDSVVTARGKREEAPADGAVEEDGADFRIGYIEYIEEFAL